MPSFKNLPSTCHQTTDGKTIWNSRSVAVLMTLFGLVDDKMYVVIEKRGTGVNDQQGKWCLPCGYLDWNETSPEGIKRELWEEVGLDLDNLPGNYLTYMKNLDQPWYVNTDPSENRQNIVLHHGAVFKFNTLPKMVCNNDCEPNEVADCKWVLVDDIDNYEFAFKHNLVVLQYLALYNRMKNK